MPHLTWGGGTETKLDLQRFAYVDNPYTDELEEKLEVSSQIDQISANFRFLITPGYSDGYYGYYKDNYGSYSAIGIEAQTSLLSKLTQFNCTERDDSAGMHIRFNANNHSYTKININIRDYSGLLEDTQTYNFLLFILVTDITICSISRGSSKVDAVINLFKNAYEMNNSGISCQLEVYGNFQ